MFHNLTCPNTNKKIKTNSVVSQRILNNYEEKYEFIHNPCTNKMVKSKGKVGQHVLRTYRRTLVGGSVDSEYACTDQNNEKAFRIKCSTTDNNRNCDFSSEIEKKTFLNNLRGKDIYCERISQNQKHVTYRYKYFNDTKEYKYSKDTQKDKYSKDTQKDKYSKDTQKDKYANDTKAAMNASVSLSDFKFKSNADALLKAWAEFKILSKSHLDPEDFRKGNRATDARFKDLLGSLLQNVKSTEVDEQQLSEYLQVMKKDTRSPLFSNFWINLQKAYNTYIEKRYTYHVKENVFSVENFIETRLTTNVVLAWNTFQTKSNITDPLKCIYKDGRSNSCKKFQYLDALKEFYFTIFKKEKQAILFMLPRKRNTPNLSWMLNDKMLWERIYELVNTPENGNILDKYFNYPNTPIVHEEWDKLKKSKSKDHPITPTDCIMNDKPNKCNSTGFLYGKNKFIDNIIADTTLRNIVKSRGILNKYFWKKVHGIVSVQEQSLVVVADPNSSRNESNPEKLRNKINSSFKNILINDIPNIELNERTHVNCTSEIDKIRQQYIKNGKALSFPFDKISQMKTSLRKLNFCSESNFKLDNVKELQELLKKYEEFISTKL